MKGLKTPNTIWEMYHQSDTAPLPVLLNELTKMSPYNSYRDLPGGYLDKRQFERRGNMSGWYLLFIISDVLRRSYIQSGGSGVSFAPNTNDFVHYPQAEEVMMTFIGSNRRGIKFMFSADGWPTARIYAGHGIDVDFDIETDITELPKAMLELRAWIEAEERAEE